MKLYIIQNEYKNNRYILADDIEGAILKFKKISEVEIISIQLVSNNVIIGD